VKEYEYQRNFELENHYWWFRGVRRAVKNLLAVGAEGKRLGKVLDVGCGTGALLDELAPLCDDLYGADVSPTALKFCAARGHKQLLLSDAQRIPAQDASFDAITAIGLIEHLDDEAAFLREMRRLCKPGGSLVLLTSSFPFLWSQHDVANEHRRRYYLRDLRRQLDAAGFSPLRTSHINFLLFPGLAAALLGHRLFYGLSAESPRRIMPEPPRPINELLTAVLSIEAELIKRVSLPWGVSMVGLWRRRP
jgi:ubiquinone/menaquinone biosynthesis C-methylase UbiE